MMGVGYNASYSREVISDTDSLSVGSTRSIFTPHGFGFDKWYCWLIGAGKNWKTLNTELIVQVIWFC